MFQNEYKTAVIGGRYVGKSTLCCAIVGKNICRDYNPTIGVDFMIKRFIINNDIKTLALWDLAGSEKFLSIVGKYVQTSKTLLFCYSADSYNSFEEMLKLFDHYKSFKYIDNKQIVIIATKNDSLKILNNYESWGLEFAGKHGFPFISTSSYNNIGITKIIDICLFKQPKLVVHVTNELNINKPTTKRNHNICCCIL